MTGVLILCCCCFLQICRSQSFKNLSSEVVSHHIFSALSITDKIKSVLPLNKAGQSHFDQYHYDDIKLYTHLLTELLTNYGDYQINLIADISQHLQFSETFQLMLPTISKLISRVTRLQDREMVLRAMNFRAVNMSEMRILNEIKFPVSSELPVLIFSSRALLYYFIPNIPVAVTQNSVLSTIQLPGNINKLPSPWYNEDTPWIVHYFDESDHYKINSYQYWIIYMSYLYEVTLDLGHKAANIPSLNCVYKHDRICDDDDFEKRYNLRELMDKHGLIVWSRENMNDLRLKYFNEKSNNCSFALYIFEAHRINKVMFANRSSTFTFGIQFMTRFILDIVNKYGVDFNVNISDVAEIRPLTNALALVEEHRFANYKIGNYQSFADLTKLIMKAGAVNDNRLLIVGCLMQNEVNAKYINATLTMLYEEYPDALKIDIKRFMIRLILYRSKNFYESHQDSERALVEIRKLATASLFIANTVSLLAKERNQVYAYSMMSELYTLRRDWSFKPAEMNLLLANQA